MSKAEEKAKFLGLLKTAQVLGKKVDLELAAEELSIPVPTLKKWTTEFSKLAESEAIEQLLELDREITDEMASQGLENSTPDDSGVRTEIIDGKIVVISKADDKATTLKAAKNAKTANLRDGLIGLQLLSADLQGTAGDIVGKIGDLIEEDTPMTPRDIASITTALTNIQQAFFNRPVTNIQVNTTNGQGETLLSTFRQKLQS